MAAVHQMVVVRQKMVAVCKHLRNRILPKNLPNRLNSLTKQKRTREQRFRPRPTSIYRWGTGPIQVLNRAMSPALQINWLTNSRCLNQESNLVDPKCTFLVWQRI